MGWLKALVFSSPSAAHRRKVALTVSVRKAVSKSGDPSIHQYRFSTQLERLQVPLPHGL